MVETTIIELSTKFTKESLMHEIDKILKESLKKEFWNYNIEPCDDGNIVVHGTKNSNGACFVYLSDNNFVDTVTYSSSRGEIGITYSRIISEELAIRHNGYVTDTEMLCEGPFGWKYNNKKDEWVKKRVGKLSTKRTNSNEERSQTSSL